MVVAAATMASWLLPSDRKRSKTVAKAKPAASDKETTVSCKHHLMPFFRGQPHCELDNNPNALGIMAFDAAKTINNLISLYRSLSDAEFARLRLGIVSSRGVAYLNSSDESFLLALACAERLEDLDRAAASVTRLGARCSDPSLARFDLVYRDLKIGSADLDKLHSSGAKELDRSLDKMEKRIAATSNLYSELEALTQLEASERRLNEWRESGAAAAATAEEAASAEAFEQKIAAQRKLVRQLKERSMWAQSFDKVVGLAARGICVVFARICAHFGPYVAVLPHVKSTSRARGGSKVERQSCHAALPDSPDLLDKLFDDPELLRGSHSGPLLGGSGSHNNNNNNNTKASLVRFMSRDSDMFESDKAGVFEGGGARAMALFSRPRNRVFQAAPPSTVGGSGLANRYANIITLAEKYIKSSYVLGEEARKELYGMLPESLRVQVRSKLKRWWRQVEVDEARRSGVGDALAVGWRDAVEEILGWLGPMARDTQTWQNEQSVETQRFDAQPTVLLMQTLHFSDLEKTEAAVGEVLVGLSCIYRYEDRPLVNNDYDSYGDGDEGGDNS